MSKKLRELKVGATVEIVSISGSQRFLSRITSIGLTIGSEIRIMSNRKKQPILVYGRDTLIAVNRDESEHILVKEMLK